MAIDKLIKEDEAYSVIMNSKEFARASNQSHHFKTTVADHSLKVTHIAIFIAVFLMKIGIPIDLHTLIVVSLCHDFGILGRFDGVFETGYDCCMHHGTRSIPAAERALGRELTVKEANCLRTHMFPLRPIPPRYLEGWILTIADKACAVTAS